MLARAARAARHAEVFTVAAEPEGAGLHLACAAGFGTFSFRLPLVDLVLYAAQGGSVAGSPGAFGGGKPVRVGGSWLNRWAWDGGPGPGPRTGDRVRGGPAQRAGRAWCVLGYRTGGVVAVGGLRPPGAGGHSSAGPVR